MTAGSPTAWGSELRSVIGGTRRILAGRDLSAAAATLTYFAGIAVVPWLLLGAWTTTWGRGSDGAERRLLDLRVLVPPDMGARPSYDVLVHAGTHVGPLGAVVLLFPASFYGEGVRRACLVLQPRPDSFTGWRARIAMTASVVMLPVVVWGLLAVADRVVGLSPEGGGGGWGDLALRVLITFNAVFVVLSVLLTWVFLAVAPGATGWRAATLGALATSSVVAGFLHGFQLFVSLPVDVGAPFAGLGVVGGVVAVGLWLFVLHLIVLVGWALTRSVEEQFRARRGPS